MEKEWRKEMRVGISYLRDNKIENAIKSIVEQKYLVGESGPYCQTCGFYIIKENVWQFEWPSEFTSEERRCKNCFPTRADLEAAIRDGRAFKHAMIQL